MLVVIPYLASAAQGNELDLAVKGLLRTLSANAILRRNGTGLSSVVNLAALWI